VATAKEVGLDPRFQRAQANVLESCDLSLCERLAGEVGERRSAPERQGAAQCLTCVLRVASRQQLPPFAELVLEAFDVELSGLDRK
jgi:hypothetical protein